jgi:hypothetical protein
MRESPDDVSRTPFIFRNVHYAAEYVDEHFHKPLTPRWLIHRNGDSFPFSGRTTEMSCEQLAKEQ